MFIALAIFSVYLALDFATVAFVVKCFRAQLVSTASTMVVSSTYLKMSTMNSNGSTEASATVLNESFVDVEESVPGVVGESPILQVRPVMNLEFGPRQES